MTDLSLIETDYHGKFCIAELYRATIVSPIIDRQGLDIDADKILCLIDDSSTGVAQFCARVALIPEMLADVVYQLSGNRYELLLRLSQAYLRNCTPAQITYYVYDALRHVERNEMGKYCLNREHDVQVWREILPFVAGRKVIPDLTETKVYEVGEGSDYSTTEPESVSE